MRIRAINNSAAAFDDPYANTGHGAGGLQTAPPEEITWGGQRGIIGGGYYNSDLDSIEYVNIPVNSDSTDFGNLTGSRRNIGGCSNGTRGVFGGGEPSTNVMDYITIATVGDAQDFGDLTVARPGLTAASNDTR